MHDSPQSNTLVFILIAAFCLFCTLAVYFMTGQLEMPRASDLIIFPHPENAT
jgi:hypothetical protein